MSLAGTIALLRSREASGRMRFLAGVSLVGFVYFVLMTSVMTFLSMFHIVPIRYGQSKSTVLKHFAAILFLLLNVVGNFINVIRVDSSLNALRRFPKVKDKDFHLECSKCERGVPRRVHHCPLCNICVLKRDHHCFFMCTCIGYFNQKYFFMFCFYMTIAGLYGSILVAIYMHLSYKVRFTGFLTFITLLPSTLRDWWFLTENPPAFTQLAVVGVFYSCLNSCLMASGVLLWQVYLTFQGLTTYEAKNGISKFSRSATENFLDVFGPYWFVTFVLPIPLPQKSDGTYSHKAAGMTAKKLIKKTTDAKKKLVPQESPRKENLTQESYKKEKDS